MQMEGQVQAAVVVLQVQVVLPVTATVPAEAAAQAVPAALEGAVGVAQLQVRLAHQVAIRPAGQGVNAPLVAIWVATIGMVVMEVLVLSAEQVELQQAVVAVLTAEAAVAATAVAVAATVELQEAVMVAQARVQAVLVGTQVQEVQAVQAVVLLHMAEMAAASRLAGRMPAHRARYNAV
jgi:hypothetical protein